MKEQAAGYDIGLIEEDMKAKGWLPVDLARRAKVSHMTVSRFLRGERQTARTAKKFADALGTSVRRYLVVVQAGRDRARQQKQAVA